MTDRPTFDFSGARCRWIENDPLVDGHQCRARTAPGRPYCNAHLARAYIKGSARSLADLDPWAAKPAPAEAEAA